MEQSVGDSITTAQSVENKLKLATCLRSDSSMLFGLEHDYMESNEFNEWNSRNTEFYVVHFFNILEFIDINDKIVIPISWRTRIEWTIFMGNII